MLLTWLASQRVPLASVDDPAFAEFMGRLAPSYQPPSELMGFLKFFSFFFFLDLFFSHSQFFLQKTKKQ